MDTFSSLIYEALHSLNKHYLDTVSFQFSFRFYVRHTDKGLVESVCCRMVIKYLLHIPEVHILRYLLLCGDQLNPIALRTAKNFILSAIGSNMLFLYIIQ